jgi:hypothetical protein
VRRPRHLLALLALETEVRRIIHEDPASAPQRIGWLALATVEVTDLRFEAHPPKKDVLAERADRRTT